MRSNIFTIVLINFWVYALFAQGTTTYNFTGSSQTWTVPPCVTSITVTAAGADGGGNLGGNGAVVTATIPVTPGQTVTINVGGSGGPGAGGYGGGGVGPVSTNGNASYNANGGGGATTVTVDGTPVIIAAGGGGAGGGSNNVAGGAGGCGSGAAGANTFGQGGGGASQSAGGAGGTPWASTPPGGQSGSFGQGGNGGLWQTASGGGGGGGYYGGGGGGNDGCCTGANGGGGGGGGSSLVPAGGGCTQGSNNAPGYVTITSGGISVSNTGPYCVGETIELTGSAAGAASYSWTGPNGFTSNLQNPTIANATPAMAGTYSLTVTGTGCSTAATTNVVVVPPIFPNAGNDSTICIGDLIQLNGTASDPASTLQWTHITTGISPVPTVSYSPSSTTIDPSVSVNQLGTYQFILAETNALCGASTDTVEISVIDVEQTYSFTSPSCIGALDGEITVVSATGVEYSIDGGNTWQPSSIFSGVGGGTYSVCTRNALGCSVCGNLVVTEPAQLTISVSNDTTICQNGTAQLSALTVAGGVISYHWDQTPSLLPNQSVQPLNTTTYSVYSTNQSGCSSPTETITVTVLPPISGTISPDTYVCPGYSTVVGASASGGIGAPYTFVWSHGDSGVGTTDSTMVSPLQSSNYSVSITDGCESSPLVLGVTVLVAPLPDPLISTDDADKCEPASFTVSNTTDPTMVQSYVWNISSGETFIDMANITTSELPAGSYDVQLIVTSPLGCVDSATFLGFLTSHAPPVANFTHDPNPAYSLNPTILFHDNSIDGDSYEWYFQGGIPDTSTNQNPISTFPEGVEGEYFVTLVTTSEYGCIDTVTKPVLIVRDLTLFVPNTFTPDDDEYNQNLVVHIEGIDIFSFNMLIFNRWGEIIWESNDPGVGWDGSYNGQIVPSGTYTWKIKAKDKINDDQYEWNGFVNVLR